MAREVRVSPGQDDWDAHWGEIGDASRRMNPANEYRARLVLENLGELQEEGTVVDVGCGQGTLTVALAARYPGQRVVGLEPSGEAVRRARASALSERSAVEFMQGDLLKDEEWASRELGPATVVVCSEVLEHVDNPVALLVKIRESLLIEGGRIVITVPGGPRSAFDRAIGHRMHFNRRSCRVMLEWAGFSPVTIVRAGFPFFNVYKLLVIMRGDGVVRDLSGANSVGASCASRVALNAFGRLFRLNLRDFVFGWQMVAVATAGTRGGDTGKGNNPVTR